MKKILIYLLSLLLLNMLLSCSSSTESEDDTGSKITLHTELEGTAPQLDQNAAIFTLTNDNLYENISNIKYTLCTDTSEIASTARTNISADKWLETDATSFSVMLPRFGEFFSDSVTTGNAYCDTIRTIYSKLFVYGVDDQGDVKTFISTIDFSSKIIPGGGNIFISLMDDPELIKTKESRIDWYANSASSDPLTIKYIVTTDTMMTQDQALNQPAQSTEAFFSYISFPVNGNFQEELTYGNETVTVYYSKLFVYAEDEVGNQSNIDSRVYGRVNQKPEYPVVRSEKLNMRYNNGYEFEKPEGQPVIVLPTQIDTWQGIDFKWFSVDPDGYEVELEYSWALYYDSVNQNGDTTQILVDSSINGPHISELSGEADTNNRDHIVLDNVPGSGDGWSETLIDVNFSAVIFDSNNEGWYTFNVRVRDDAGAESEHYSTTRFYAANATFNNKILVVDNVDEEAFDYDSGEGNPDNQQVELFYKKLLEDTGSSSYDYYQFHDAEPFSELIPLVKLFSQYRLVIIQDAGRSRRNNSINFDKYAAQVEEYLNIGGKVWVIGASSFIFPPEISSSNYFEAQRFDLVNPEDNYISPQLPLLRDYFGMKSITFSEEYESNIYEEREARLNFGNYDFIGAEKSANITSNIVPLRIDSTIVNNYWNKTRVTGAGLKKSWILKENGSVFTGVASMEPYNNSDIVMNYTSIHDLPKVTWSNGAESDSLVYDPLANDLQHNLYCPYNWYIDNDETITEDPKKVQNRNGAVAMRHTSDNNRYKTAYFGFPLFFMDNSTGAVDNNFKEMIEWFDLDYDPLQNL